MECFYPGRVLVGPGRESGGSRNLSGILSREFRGDFDFEFGIDEILKHYGLEIRDHSAAHTLPFVGRVPEGAESEIALRLSRFPRHQVEAATPDYLVRPSGPIAIDQSVLNQTIKILNAFPGDSRCGSGCTVGILDSGVDPQYLANAASLNPKQYDTLAPSGPGTALSDPIGHGSLVACIVNAIAPAAKLISIKTFDQNGTISSVIAGLYVAHSAGPCDVVNLSLKVSCEPDACAVCGTPSAATINMAQLAYFFQTFMQGAKNSVLIAAAGNNVSHLTMPAAFDDIIAVGSFDYGALSPISSYQHVPSTRFVLAPGGKDGPGNAFAAQSVFGLPKYLYGTSFAAAFITGFAAKTVCGWRGGPSCGTRLVGQPAPSLSLGLMATVLSEIDARADRTWAGYDPALHGLGAILF